MNIEDVRTIGDLEDFLKPTLYNYKHGFTSKGQTLKTLKELCMTIIHNFSEKQISENTSKYQLIAALIEKVSQENDKEIQKYDTRVSCSKGSINLKIEIES